MITRSYYSYHVTPAAAICDCGSAVRLIGIDVTEFAIDKEDLLAVHGPGTIMLLEHCRHVRMNSKVIISRLYLY